MLVNFSLGGMFALLAPYAKLWIGGSASTYGFMLAAFSLGLFVGAYFIGKLRQVREYVGKLQIVGVIAMDAIMTLIGLATIQFASIALLFGFGFVLSSLDAPLQALYQAKVPQELFGRVVTVVIALLSIIQPLSVAISENMAVFFTIGGAYVIYGVLTISVAIGVSFGFSELRMAEY